MPLLLILLPLLAAATAWALPWAPARRWSLPAVALVHAGLTLGLLADPAAAAQGGPWLGLDAPGQLVLTLNSLVYLACAFYAVGYLRQRPDRPDRGLVACLHAFLGIVTLCAFARHFGLLWVSMEAATLCSAPMLYFNHNQRSLEATWKYLLIGSVGIALALFGTFFLAYASLGPGLQPSLFLADLLRQAPALAKPWLHGAFIFLLVGYGTKMGLAPMHTWKPDAYGEAPGLVGNLLASVLTSCAFLALFRVQQVMVASGEAGFSRPLLIFLGLLSMAFAAAGIFGQRDFKRMLAYSSVEHMGILSLGLGIGGAGVFAAAFHMVNNALTKGVLFQSAGNIHRAYGSKDVGEVRGALRRVPVSGTLFLLGFIAITGSPPFSPFMSEYAILLAAFARGHLVVGGLYLALLMLVFIGMGGVVLRVVLGKPPLAKAGAVPHEGGRLTVAPALVLMALVLLLGLWIPGPLRHLLEGTSQCLQVPR